MIAIAVDSLVILGIKAIKILTTVAKIDKKITLLRVYKEALSFRTGNVNIPIIFLVIFFSIYLAINASPFYIIPVIAIGLGLICNFIGSITEIIQFLFYGYWMIITGIGAVILNTISPMLAVSVIFGGGGLLFAITSMFEKEETTEE